jgi:hypothetical protein
MSSDSKSVVAKGMAFPTNTDESGHGAQTDAPVVVSQVVINISVGSMLIETWSDGAVSVNGDRVEQTHDRKQHKGAAR